MSQFQNQPFQPQHQAKPPKKKHTLRTVLIVIGAAVGLLIVLGALIPNGEPAKAPTSIPSKAGTSAVPSVKPSVAPSSTGTSEAACQAAMKADYDGGYVGTEPPSMTSAVCAGIDSDTLLDLKFKAILEGTNTPPPAKPTKTAPKVTASQEQAIGSAESYLEFSAFSRKGLIDQLVYEGFSKADATYGVDHVTVDWKEQAAKSAKSYLETSHFSRRGLIEQLEYEGFSRAQATYGVTKAGL